MSSNVGLTTPRGSGTSGYVQRNSAFMKPRNSGYGAPYPPVAGAHSDFGRPFKQRQPDKQILEHDRRRAIEVKVMEERERLEEANEQIEEGNKSKSKSDDAETEKPEAKILSDEEIDERCEVLRARLLKEMEEDDKEQGDAKQASERNGRGPRGMMPPPPKERRQFKSYQVHELAEAKIEESERLRKALGIKEDRETGEISSKRRDYEGKRDREHDRH